MRQAVPVVPAVAEQHDPHPHPVLLGDGEEALLMVREQTPDAIVLDWMIERDKKVFADLKFFDIPATVGSAVRQLKDRGAACVTGRARGRHSAGAAGN